MLSFQMEHIGVGFRSCSAKSQSPSLDILKVRRRPLTGQRFSLSGIESLHASLLLSSLVASETLINLSWGRALYEVLTPYSQ